MECVDPVHRLVCSTTSCPTCGLATPNTHRVNVEATLCHAAVEGRTEQPMFGRSAVVGTRSYGVPAVNDKATRTFA